MAFDGEMQAAKRVGPARAADTTKINRAFRTPSAPAGSASWTIPGTGAAFPGCWVTITNIGTSPTDLMAVSFQRSSETLANGDSANDYVLAPGNTQDFWCDQGVDTVRFAGPATAIASHYRSSL
jgi:hypothetical protein